MRTRADQYREFNGMLVKLIVFCMENNILIKIGELWRTPEQALIYSERGTGIVNSKHIYSLAVDIMLITPDGLGIIKKGADYSLMGAFWKDMGGIWGGDFEARPDVYHFEFSEKPILATRGKSVQQT